MNKINKLYKIELEHLSNAIKNGSSPFHIFSLSSSNKNFPESRMIVLRGVTLKPFKIYFNADYRSSKVQELKNNHFCSALFYDQKRRVQIRCKCQATIHYQNDISKKVWESTLLQSRKCYMGPFAPSQKLDEWHPNIPDRYLKSDPEQKHSEEGYINFTHIELKVLETDVLHLHHDGHLRFKADNRDNLFYISP